MSISLKVHVRIYLAVTGLWLALHYLYTILAIVDIVDSTVPVTMSNWIKTVTTALILLYGLWCHSPKPSCDYDIGKYIRLISYIKAVVIFHGVGVSTYVRIRVFKRVKRKNNTSHCSAQPH